MPLLGTRGAASAQGFGMFGGGADTSTWFSVSSLGTQSNSIATNSSGAIAYGYAYTGFGDAFALVNNLGTTATAGAYLAYSQGDGDVFVDSSNNIYTCTWNGSSNQKWFVAKYNSSGSNTWAKEIVFSTDYFNSPKIGVDSSGNVYLCGGRRTSSNTQYSLCVVKLDSSGALSWANYYYDASYELYQASNPLFDGSGNLTIALRFATVGAGICTMSSSGSITNVYSYSNVELDGGGGGGPCIAKDASGNFYLPGGRPSPNQPALLKLDSSYNVSWCYYINDPSGNFVRTTASGVAVDPTTNDVYLGNFYLFNSPSRACVARITSGGSLSWIRSIGVSTNTTRPAGVKSVAAYQKRFNFAVSNQTLSASPLIFSTTNDGGVTGTSGNYSSGAITSSLTALSPARSSASLSATTITPTVNNSTSTSATPTLTKTSL